jgi:hypothetical protein
MKSRYVQERIQAHLEAAKRDTAYQQRAEINKKNEEPKTALCQEWEELCDRLAARQSEEYYAGPLSGTAARFIHPSRHFNFTIILAAFVFLTAAAFCLAQQPAINRFKSSGIYGVGESVGWTVTHRRAQLQTSTIRTRRCPTASRRTLIDKRRTRQ